MGRKPGRALWDPLGDQPDELAEKVRAVLECWRRNIETQRSGLANPPMQLTAKRGRAIAEALTAWPLEDLLGAIAAYAARGWNQANKAWVHLVPDGALSRGFLDPRRPDLLESCVAEARRLRNLDELERMRDRGEQQRQQREADEQAAVEAEIERLWRDDPWAMADLIDHAVAAMPEAHRAMVMRSARRRKDGKVTMDNRFVAAAVRLLIRERLGRNASEGTP